jgi:peptidyl-tRNA hydrolase, PTH1 family
VAQAIIGLGNPGTEYQGTRHNVGHRVVEGLARSLGARFDRASGHAIAEAEWQEETVYLVKPRAFVNESGPAVARICRRLHLGPADIVVVFDDLDLPLGSTRIRMKGTAGGHNGVRSLIQALGTSDFRRVKVGIGRPAPPGERRHEVVDHVLSPFRRDELDVIEQACTEAANLALQLVTSRAADAP